MIDNSKAVATKADLIKLEKKFDKKFDDNNSLIATALNNIFTELKSIKADIAEIKSELKSFKKEVRADFKEIRAELKEFKIEVRADIKDIRSDIKEMKIEFRTDIKELKFDVKSIKVGIMDIESEFTTRFSETMGELQVTREEHIVLTHQVSKVEDDIARHEPRISLVEKQLVF